jgi:hypothetical protein
MIFAAATEPGGRVGFADDGGGAVAYGGAKGSIQR